MSAGAIDEIGPQTGSAPSPSWVDWEGGYLGQVTSRPLSARSRFTSSCCDSEPKFVRRNVSGAIPILKESWGVEEGDSSVMVRHVPFTQMLSPRWASSRISEQSLIVSEVPPPPLDVSSCFIRLETASWTSA